MGRGNSKRAVLLALVPLEAAADELKPVAVLAQALGSASGMTTKGVTVLDDAFENEITLSVALPMQSATNFSILVGESMRDQSTLYMYLTVARWGGAIGGRAMCTPVAKLTFANAALIGVNRVLAHWKTEDKAGTFEANL